MTEHIGFLLSDISRLMRKRFDLAARSIGVTGPQWRLLFVLEREPGQNQGQIAERMEVEPITTCRMIDRLEQAGLVERRRDPADRRAWQIFNTPAATPLLDRLRLVGDELSTQSLTGLSAKDADRLRDLLARVRANVAGPATDPVDTSDATDPADTSDGEARHG